LLLGYGVISLLVSFGILNLFHIQILEQIGINIILAVGLNLIVGFSGVHTRYHFYRAIIEGLAFALREGMDTIVKKTHKKPTKIIVSGGGSRSDIFVQIITIRIICIVF